MKDIRKRVLDMPIGDIVNDLKSGMNLANRCGDICATVYYANRVNALEDVIDFIICVIEAEEG